MGARHGPAVYSAVLIHGRHRDHAGIGRGETRFSIGAVIADRRYKCKAFCGRRFYDSLQEYIFRAGKAHADNRHGVGGQPVYGADQVFSGGAHTALAGNAEDRRRIQGGLWHKARKSVGLIAHDKRGDRGAVAEGLAGILR